MGDDHMPAFHITMMTACILGLIFVILSILVVKSRVKANVSLGQGEQLSVAMGQEGEASKLLVASRSHANFAEYVPLSLILLGYAEAAGGKQMIICILATMLVISRTIHPFGMGRKAPNPFRFGGMLLQWLMLIATSVYGLILVNG
jgi:uncharacterized protein